MKNIIYKHPVKALISIKISRGGKGLFYVATGFGTASTLFIAFMGEKYYLWHTIPMVILAIIALTLATRPKKTEIKRKKKP